MMSKNGAILILFAWVMEIVGVSGGIINSTYTTFGEALPHTFAGYIPAVPMVALAVAELGRVPLSSVIFHKHKLTQGVAILGILALGYLAVENWTFGFERIVDLRLKPVNTASRELLRAEGELAALVDQRKRMTSSSGQKRDELRGGVEQRDASIAELSTQISKEAEVHQKNLEAIKEACRLIRDKCIVPRSLAEDRRYAADVDRLSTELARQREERKILQSQIDELVKTDHSDVAGLDQKVRIAERTVTEAGKSLRSARDGNQIYRLVASWYGVSTSDVTEEQFATGRWVFATFSAVAVALAGSIAALVYYARSRVPGAPSLVGKFRPPPAHAGSPSWRGPCSRASPPARLPCGKVGSRDRSCSHACRSCAFAHGSWPRRRHRRYRPWGGSSSVRPRLQSASRRPKNAHPTTATESANPRYGEGFFSKLLERVLGRSTEASTSAAWNLRAFTGLYRRWYALGPTSHRGELASALMRSAGIFPNTLRSLSMASTPVSPRDN